MFHVTYRVVCIQVFIVARYSIDNKYKVARTFADFSAALVLTMTGSSYFKRDLGAAIIVFFSGRGNMECCERDNNLGKTS